MATDQTTSGLQPISTNQGLQPIVTNTVTPSKPLKVPETLLRDFQNPILIESGISTPNHSSSPRTNIIHNSIAANKRNYIVVADNDETNKSKLAKIEELPNSDIEVLKRQIEEEEAKLKLMLQIQSQKIVTSQPTQFATIPSSYHNSTPNKMRKPIIIHAANEVNKNTMNPAILINSDNHSKHSNILISRPSSEASKQDRIGSKPTIIHGSLHTDKLHQNTLPLVAETLSPNGLEPGEFRELQELQIKVRNIAQRYSIPLPTAKHPNLFLSKHNHPKKNLSKMIERKLIKAQLPPTQRQVWPIIPFADTNFQYAVGLEEAVLYVTGETDCFSTRHKQHRVVCLTCGSDFGSGWQGSKSAFFCEACDSAQQMKEHRNALVAHLNGLIRDVESDEREFDRYSELLTKQQIVLHQTQSQQPQQQQQESYIISQSSDGQYHIPANSIALSNATGSRINSGTVIHQKQDKVQYVTINTSEANKLQPIAGLYIQQNATDKSKNGQANMQIRNVVYAQLDQNPVVTTHKK
ncbi:Transcriptional repressor p66-beta-like [Oopsacas minuta]|uniref:Transcriptional repressor p66-beta-like n=1 Tax=Oopsacas minuta TaxID=111878 RepID=A0AAV7JWM8_9METZ|nr:Transcriptional repressor p66-beta-like [Oopsacas minuta]